jgi:hypothetical protein
MFFIGMKTDGRLSKIRLILDVLGKANLKKLAFFNCNVYNEKG